MKKIAIGLVGTVLGLSLLAGCDNRAYVRYGRYDRDYPKMRRDNDFQDRREYRPIEPRRSFPPPPPPRRGLPQYKHR
jgi:hypothetical protein